MLALHAALMRHTSHTRVTCRSHPTRTLQGIPPNVLQGGPVALLQFMRYNYRYDDN